MAEAEVKKNSVSGIMKLLLGIVILGVGILATVVFFDSLKEVVKGIIGPLLILIGLIIMAVAKE